MFPGIGKIDPRKMQQMMKQMGINQEEIDASRVIIEKNDGDSLIIENPQVSKITMQGQETYQVIGDVTEGSKIKEEDIKMVMEKTGATKEKAQTALEETNGDLAEAIINLNS